MNAPGITELNWACAVEFGARVQFRQRGRRYLLDKRCRRHLKPGIRDVRIRPDAFTGSLDCLVEAVGEMLMFCLVQSIACRGCPAMEPFDAIAVIAADGWRELEFTPAGDTTWLGVCPACAGVTAQGDDHDRK